MIAKGLVALEKEYGNFYAPAFAVEVGSVDIKGLGAEVTGVSVDKVLNVAGQFSFTVNNPFNAASGEFEWLDNKLFDVGNELVIKMGYGSRLKPILTGLITSIKASFPAGGTSQLEVSGYDLSHKMMKAEKSRPWKDQSDSDMVAAIAQEHGFDTSNVEDSNIYRKEIKQDKQTDFVFIGNRAEKIGFEFSVEGNKFHFRPPAIDEEAELLLEWGKTLNSFSPEINNADQVSEVKVMGWDPASKKQIVGSALNPFAGAGDKSVKEVRKPVDNQADADSLAQSILNKIMEGLVRGNGECIGLPDIKPGITVEIKGLGNKFSATYYVEKTTHTIGTSGYKTTFEARVNTV